MHSKTSAGVLDCAATARRQGGALGWGELKEKSIKTNIVHNRKKSRLSWTELTFTNTTCKTTSDGKTRCHR